MDGDAIFPGLTTDAAHTGGGPSRRQWLIGVVVAVVIALIYFFWTRKRATGAAKTSMCSGYTSRASTVCNAGLAACGSSSACQTGLKTCMGTWAAPINASDQASARAVTDQNQILACSNALTSMPLPAQTAFMGALTTAAAQIPATAGK